MAVKVVLKCTAGSVSSWQTNLQRSYIPRLHLYALPGRGCQTQALPAVTCAAHRLKAQRRLRCRAQTDVVVPEIPVEQPAQLSQANGGARELLTWVYELPWTRIAIWATVAVTASQFQDFFGVRIGPCMFKHP